jgi:hypothetical protein
MKKRVEGDTFGRPKENRKKGKTIKRKEGKNGHNERREKERA